jgi:hypothetical protein
VCAWGVENGWGVPRDPKTAAQWYQKVRRASCSLGVFPTHSEYESYLHLRRVRESRQRSRVMCMGRTTSGGAMVRATHHPRLHHLQPTAASTVLPQFFFKAR